MHRNRGISPSQDLFIYYLNGRLRPDDEIFQDNFIGNWEEEDDSFLFFSSPASGQVRNLLSRQPQLSYIDSYRMPYTQWLGEVFHAFEHGKFYVVPPWDTSENLADAHNEKFQILLDPGLVFGTGTHPTTRNCLDALELAAGSTQIHTVLDLGTGTGLLAIAAARLGSQRILAVDLNLLAARTAERNVRLNQLQKRVIAVQGKAEDMIAYSADLVIANIHYDVMRHLVESEGFLAKRRFILSGLLRGEAKEIAARLSRSPVKILKQWTQDGIWHTFYGKRDLSK
jgi:ribosomal protein L11 methyltransferase